MLCHLICWIVISWGANKLDSVINDTLYLKVFWYKLVFGCIKIAIIIVVSRIEWLLFGFVDVFGIIGAARNVSRSILMF